MCNSSNTEIPKKLLPIEETVKLLDTPDINLFAKQAEPFSLIPLNGKKPFEKNIW